MKRIRRYVLWFIAAGTLLWFLACASEMPLTGGPVDKTPPQIIKADPPNGSLQVSLTPTIKLVFNEQVKKEAVRQALQVWPLVPAGWEIKTGWTYVKLRPREPLQPDQTYLLILDKGAQDLQGNNLSEPFVLAFSTGNKIARGRISGLVLGAGSVLKKGRLYLYPGSGQAPQELLRGSPAYILQADDDGRFAFSYLPEKPFVFFFHWDRNGNGRLDAGDFFARPPQRQVQPTSDGTTVRFWPREIPPSRLHLSRVRVWQGHLLEFWSSRPVVDGSLTGLELRTEEGLIPLAGKQINRRIPQRFWCYSTLPLDTGQVVWLSGFRDTTGVILGSDTLALTMPPATDTLRLRPGEVELVVDTAKKAMTVDLPLPVNSVADSCLSIKPTGDSLFYACSDLERPSLFEIRCPLADSLFRTGFSWRLELNKLHLFTGVVPDSVLQGQWTPPKEDSTGILTIRQDFSENLFLTVSGPGGKRLVAFPQGEALQLPALKEGRYTLVAFQDLDADGRYFTGGITDLRPAEWFWIYPDTVTIRRHWETDLGLWQIEREQ